MHVVEKEREMELPKKNPNIELLRRKLEERDSLIIEPTDPIVHEQNIQLEQMRAKIESLKRKRNRVIEDKIKLERQTSLLNGEFTK